MIKKNTFFFLFFLFISASFLRAQSLTVTGNVTDKSGVPLPGVNIIVKETNNGTSSDFDGNYKIDALQEQTLVFSFIGFETKEVTVTNVTVNVILEEDLNELEEIVVTAFGIKKKERALGYAVQKVDAEDLDLKGQNNAIQGLQGKVSGVQISKTSGSAGGGVDILIRGVTSVDPSRDNQPLIIVDGLAINNSTSVGGVLPSSGSNAPEGSLGSSEQFSFSNRAGDINPDDIESFSILKGAAATALYGVRAANGAILITTKKGKEGKAKIVLTASSTFSEVVTTPELQKTWREGHRTTQFPGVLYEPNTDDGFDFLGFTFYSWGPRYSDDSFDRNGTILDLTNDRFYDPYDLFRTGVNTQLNVNVSGANEKLNYYFSIGKSNDEGVLPNTDYEKINLRFNGGLKITDKLTLNSSISYSKSGGSRGNGGDKSIFSSLSYWSATIPINDYLNPDGSQRNYSGGFIDNPRYFAETSNLKDNVNRWVGNMQLNWAPNDWFNFTYSAQIDNYSDLRNRFVPPDLDVGVQVGGFIVDETINFTGLESNLLLTFTKDFSEDFKASLLVGHQISDTKNNYSFIRGEGLNVPGINHVSNTTNVFAGNNVRQLRDMGVFGDLRFEYKNQLFLSITGRNDWVSGLSTKNRSFFYPSISLSYVFSELIDVDKDVLSFGKLRASYAEVGKGPGFAQNDVFYSKPDNFAFNGSSGYESNNRIGNRDLASELVKNYEIGVDLRFFKNRLRIDYSYYTNKVSDQIFPVGLAYSSSNSSFWTNAGDYETFGHEFLIGGDIIKNENFKWEATINWSTSEGKVTALPEGFDEIIFFDDRITAKAKVGDKIGTLYGWVFQTAPNGERYVGSDGKWVVTGSENSGFAGESGNVMVKVGNAFPNYVASLSNTLSWKNFDFNFLLEYKEGGDLYDRGFRNSLRNGNLIETEFRNEERVLEGVMDDGSGGFVPNTQPLLITADSFYRDSNNYNTASEVLLQDGSWIKLRTIGLSYNFDGKLIEKLGMSNASISASAHNILIWTPFKGFDPEGSQFSAGSNIYGFTGLTTPLTQSYSLGVKFEF